MLGKLIAVVLLTATPLNALSIDTSSSDSICEAASIVADGLMDYYSGTKTDGTVGYFDGGYYWWEYAEAFHSLVDFSYRCDNDTYLSDIRTGIVSQLGDDNDFYPSAQKQNIGNDDQTFWGLLALNCHSYGMDPPSSSVSWLDVVENIYDVVKDRWDSDTCNGGVRWQILTDHSGYDYKNSITNGNLLLISAQLYDITGETKYLTMAKKIWTWLTDEVAFVKQNDDGVLSVYDGATTGSSCETMTSSEWSYNYGTILGSLSYLYNATSSASSVGYNTSSTSSSTWGNYTSQIVEGVETFFNDDDIMYERTCQLTDTCNEDERCFKSILTRNMAISAQLYPKISSTIQDYLKTSAKGAAKSCSGGSDDVTCGLSWYAGEWDGYYGIGEQMNALAIFTSLLVV